MGMVRKGSGQSTSHGCSNGKSESREIWLHDLTELRVQAAS